MKVYFTKPALTKSRLDGLKSEMDQILNCSSNACLTLDAEHSFYVESVKLDEVEQNKIEQFLHTDCSPHQINSATFLGNSSSNGHFTCILEFGPRLHFTTAYSTNAVLALRSSGITDVSRLERFIRYEIVTQKRLSEDDENKICAILHDRMTECLYAEPPKSFAVEIKKKHFFEINILRDGKSALEMANKQLGLALDSDDIDFYYDIFANKANRNPTNVELFDLAQSNSEHSRHWFFKGRLVVNRIEIEDSLFKMVMNTQLHSNKNNVIQFCDNSSAIQGCTVNFLKPSDPTQCSQFAECPLLRHITYTAETHNFPTGVCPFPGAATGTGGRIRDGHAAGRGSHVVAGVAGYSFGNLNIPGHQQPWEDSTWKYPSNFAKPLEICIQASNGASDYGNKFGEPVLCGFARSFGQILLDDDERIEYIKPIMFSGGMGTIDDGLLKKCKPRAGMIVAKIGGPVYRIGVGGGSASSVNVKDGESRCESLDFRAVQRGDAQMEQKLNRVVRACAELGAKLNPIKSIHDQGAGGNGNVLKEIVEGVGARIYADNFELGDPSIDALELWGAEYQESDAVLVEKDQVDVLQKICDRERCTLSNVGETAADNTVKLIDFGKTEDDPCPVDLNLDWVLGEVPRKKFELTPKRYKLPDLQLPKFDSASAIEESLRRVLNLPSVASKRYLTNKVDRSITGLVAQQQCVGCLHTPLADVAVTALSYFHTVGSAVALGEQPLKMLVDPEKGARMTVGEALTNLVFAPITALKDVKCSANWMWPAKLDGEGEKLYSACKAMCEVMERLGIAVDGGKDSLSMAAVVKQNGTSQIVKSPGTLVISTYAQCTDIMKVVTPDLKCMDDCEGTLLYVNFAGRPDDIKYRLGGSALAQCYGQLGNTCPDLDSTSQFTSAFEVTQKLIQKDFIVAGHDVSDGGLIVALLEMAFAGNCGLTVRIPSTGNLAADLYNEELGVVLEVKTNHADFVLSEYRAVNVHCVKLGDSLPGFGPDAEIEIRCGREKLIGPMIKWRSEWEKTSYVLEKLQCEPKCADSEFQTMQQFVKSPYKWDQSTILDIEIPIRRSLKAPKLAVLREEGTNGDREMAAAFFAAGFAVWDLCMQDLLSKTATLDPFDGIAFAGGFSYADVFGAAKGWANCLLYNEDLRGQFDRFKNDKRKFSFGACNGCQLMALIGWVGDLPEEDQKNGTNNIILDSNESGRFESRFSNVVIEETDSIMLKYMEGSILGVWVAHGEGRFTFSAEKLAEKLDYNGLITCRYVDWSGQPTQVYPMNPNGSPLGIAGLRSADGRHLAMMPHPERSFLQWQWPNYPASLTTIDRMDDDGKSGLLACSPWMQMFTNAYDWCMENR